MGPREAVQTRRLFPVATLCLPRDFLALPPLPTQERAVWVADLRSLTPTLPSRRHGELRGGREAPERLPRRGRRHPRPAHLQLPAAAGDVVSGWPQDPAQQPHVSVPPTPPPGAGVRNQPRPGPHGASRRGGRRVFSTLGWSQVGDIPREGSQVARGPFWETLGQDLELGQLSAFLGNPRVLASVCQLENNSASRSTPKAQVGTDRGSGPVAPGQDSGRTGRRWHLLSRVDSTGCFCWAGGCVWVSISVRGCVFWLRGGGEAWQGEEHTVLSELTRALLCSPGQGWWPPGLWAEGWSRHLPGGWARGQGWDTAALLTPQETARGGVPL